MKYLLIILLFLPLILLCQNPDTVDHPSFGEYYNLVYKASTHKAYNILNVVPQLMTNQPTYVSEIYGGPHDQGCTDPSGGLWLSGSVFSTGFGAFQHVTVDSAGNSLPFVSGMNLTGTNTAPFWTDVIWTTDSTTGRQVGIAGQLSGGMHGNGINSNANQTSFVWATFPNGTHIVKVCGLYGLWALDSKGHVWSWGFNNNKAQLQRGTSPSISYLLPDSIRLPAGRHAVDICDAGGFGVILLDDGEVLGGGDQPKYWGGSGASSSNTPQNFTSFLTTSAGLAPITGIPFVPAKLFCDAGAIFYIGTDSSLVGSGDNICGEVGNGSMFPMNNYAVSPPPSGSFPQPYAYDNGYGEFLVSAPVRICPGTHNWVCGYMGPSNCWNANFVNNLGETWVWGRYKSGQLMGGMASCNYISGGLNGSYPDMINQAYPIKISPFSITSGNLITPTCFYCIANPGAANCSQGASCYNGSLAAPVVNCEGKRTLPIGTASFVLSSSITYASGDHQQSSIWTQKSGPAAVMPFHTTSTPIIYASTPGTYVFQDSATGQMWKTGVDLDTVVIANIGIGPIPVGVKANVVTTDSTWMHTILASTSGYYTADTLSLPPNSLGVFNLSYLSYDTVQHFTGIGQQTVMLSRNNATYGAAYISYNSPYVTTGISTHQSGYNITSINGLPIVQVQGYGPANPIRWHILKKTQISPL